MVEEKTKITPIIAAIDLGTNSCRLLVAKADGVGVKIVDSFSKIVRLGEGIQKTGLLSQTAIERTMDALRVCQTKIEDNHAQKVRAVTTEACRRASNSSALLDRAINELHINLEVISSAEEARLALVGCTVMLEPRVPYALTFDIGGGSTEIMWLKIELQPGRLYRRQISAPKVLDWISLPYGVVTTSEELGRVPVTADDYEHIASRVQTALANFTARNSITHFLKHNQVQMVGTSGTVTTLAAIQLKLPRYERRLVDGGFFMTQDLRKVIDSLLSMDYPTRVRHNCIGPGRGDLILVGSAILEGIYRSFTIPYLRVADRGVREGILLELMEAMKKEQPELFPHAL